MFHGYDNDQTMVRIGAMNLLLHGIEQPDLVRQDSLAEPAPGGRGLDSNRFSLILANPPFSGSLDSETVSSDLQRIVKTKKTELLFLAAIIKLLRVGGRAAIIVPEGVLFGASKPHKELRRILVEDQKLEAIVKLPSGVFRPYAGVSTAILFFTKTNSGGTDRVWLYEMKSDGFTLDDKRNPTKDSDIPDILERWHSRHSSELERSSSEQSFVITVEQIREKAFDLAFNRYQSVTHSAPASRAPAEILDEITALQIDIEQELEKLRGLLR